MAANRAGRRQHRGAPGGLPPGRGAPGGLPPGRGAPGGLPPGRGAPGGLSPDRGAPGGLPPGRGAPGGLSPGGLSPDRGAPGGLPPSRGAPGGLSPGRGEPGGRSPGGRSPGGRSPGVQRRAARVTVKYNRQELQRRLDTERWIDGRLGELYRGREGQMPDELNLDELLELSTDEERAQKLRAMLSSCPADTQAFIAQLLVQLRELPRQRQLQSPPRDPQN